ncbi:MAG TPA: sugar-binding transcriptional regulator [Terriglobales bacterium]|nr:sugar-binding transcriptional regulator [Terriglobales bacterium]
MAQDRTETDFVSSDEQLQVRIAWHYYVEGLTQKEIAEKLDVNRVRVNRLLSASRANGLVQVQIHGRLSSCVDLEQKLIADFGLREAIVVPSSDDPELIQESIGFATGNWISDNIDQIKSIGIGWGRTLRLSLRSIRGSSMPDLSVVSLLGSLTRGDGTNTFEIAYRFADIFDAQRHYLAAPVFASSRALRDSILAEDELRMVIDRARNVDTALLSVGDLSLKSLMVRLTPVKDHIHDLQQAGAVGDILGHFLDRNGAVVDHPINQRVIGLEFADLSRINRVVLASGGLHKLDILRAVLQRRLVHVLIIDETTARHLTT